MKDHIFTTGIIDRYGDVACAVLTGQEADTTIETEDGHFHKDTIYVYGSDILNDALLAELKYVLNFDADVSKHLPTLTKLRDYLETNLH